MATGTWTTTTEEDAAILALTGETPTAFIARHVRHQVDFAVSQRRASVKAIYDTLPETERAEVDAILLRNAPAPKGAG